MIRIMMKDKGNIQFSVMCPHSNLRKPPLNFVVAMTEFLSLPSGFLSREVLRDICGTAVDIS